MDRRTKKLEKRRKDREAAKKRNREAERRRASESERLVRSAERGDFGPCFVSEGWDNLDVPALVTVVVSRVLGNGTLLPCIALVDRTCLGVKGGFVGTPLWSHEVSEFVERIGQAHGGMVACEPLVAQSVVFHAIDYAGKLGFAPHRDVSIELFSPRPETLLPTPWHAREKPYYVQGPRDDVRAITARLNLMIRQGHFTDFDFVLEAEHSEDLELPARTTDEIEAPVSRMK